MQRGGDRGKYAVLPCLREKMKQSNASIPALAKAAGVSIVPIMNALRGGKIRHYNAQFLYEALNTRAFSRQKGGKKL